ncbi:hypothetical protein H0H92_003765 [Tricholoma furcatifolium]|nr:hypothetical protein H0H92_003765 [Tricholoma furcatifolium]
MEPIPMIQIQPSYSGLSYKASISLQSHCSPRASTMQHPPQARPFSVKSGSEWNNSDLKHCNVNIIDVDFASFFDGLKEVPVPSVSPAILSTKAAFPQQPHPLQTHTALMNEERSFFKYLEAAMVAGELQTSAITDFIFHTLQLLGFTEPKPSKLHNEHVGHHRRVLRRDHDLPLFMCGRTVHTTADLCLLFPGEEEHHGNQVLLLAKAAPFPTPGSEPQCAEAQLIAQAIGAFQCYNRDRRRARLDSVETEVIPGLIMQGTTPILYKIEITASLVECVQSAQKPTRVTSVKRLRVPMESPGTVVAEGMIPLGNRKIMLGYLEALKGLI